MKATNDAIPKSCMQVINVLAESEVNFGLGADWMMGVRSCDNHGHSVLIQMAGYSLL